MDLCDPQSNCAIYTGRLLGSDEASATEVFEMVQDWLASQNGSVLNGTLSIDPNCPLRRLSPSDAACSTPMNNVTPPNSNDDQSNITLIHVLIISLVSILIVCSIIIIIVCTVCVCRSHGSKKDSLIITANSQSSSHVQSLVVQDNQRHYSIITQGNPSYDHCHGNDVHTHQNSSLNSELLREVTIVSGNSTGSCTHQQTGSTSDQQQVTHAMLQSNGEVSEYDDIVHSPSSSLSYCNEDDNIFHSGNHPASYLSLTHTQ